MMRRSAPACGGAMKHHVRRDTPSRTGARRPADLAAECRLRRLIDVMKHHADELTAFAERLNHIPAVEIAEDAVWAANHQ